MLGTLGIVLRAKRHGLIDSAADIIRHLRELGFYLDDVIVGSALESVDETWE
ncbi:MAG: DUF3368 domain-containing protein [Planctomycetes bacterium]|nr:DUF3368 domain-containing protein [Planctomycetota bacterium]